MKECESITGIFRMVWKNYQNIVVFNKSKIALFGLLLEKGYRKFMVWKDILNLIEKQNQYKTFRKQKIKNFHKIFLSQDIFN